MPNDSDQANRPLLTAAEAAVLLRRSRSWVFAHLREIPHVRLPGGGGALFDREQLLAWARGLTVKPCEHAHDDDQERTSGRRER